MNPVNSVLGPRRVTWEMTQVSTIDCLHWRIESKNKPDPDELTTREGKNLIDQLDELGTRRLILAGGDPLERNDLGELIQYAREKNIKLTLQATPSDKLVSKVINDFSREGFFRISLPLDAPYPELHNKFWNKKNVFQDTIELAYEIRENEMPLQINTVITSQSAPLMADLFLKISSLNPVTWKIYFLVPTGGDETFQPPGFHVTRIIFEEIYELEQEVNFEILAVEAPYYNRFWLENKTEELGINLEQYTSTLNPLSVEKVDEFLRKKITFNPKRFRRQPGRESLFINHRGTVYPGRFLPLECGNLRTQSIREIFRDSPVLKQLRNPLELGGCCQKTNCWAREICGGSRGRAYFFSGDHMGTDPLCFYHALKTMRP